MKNRKESLIMIIIIAILLLGLGYAYLTTNLSINGTADVDSNTWDVHWDNVQVLDGSVTGTQVTQAPTISNQTTVSFHIRLKEPGEYYEFTVDAKNIGTIDAVIDTITKTVNNSTTIPGYLDYSVTYYDYFPIEKCKALNIGETERYRIRIEYKSDIDPQSLPATSQSLNISFGANYTQAKDDTKYSRYYFSGGAHVVLNEPLESTDRLHDKTKDMIDRRGRPYSILFTIIVKDNIVDEIYMRFIVNNKVYFIRGGGATYNENTLQYNNDSIYYYDNVAILNEAFGEDACRTEESNGIYGYVCGNNFVGAAQSGELGGNANGFGYGCGMNSDYSISCGG